MSLERITDFVLKDVSIPESALDMAATLLVDTIGLAHWGWGCFRPRVDTELLRSEDRV